MGAAPRARGLPTSSRTSALPHRASTALLHPLPQLPGCHLTLQPPPAPWGRDPDAPVRAGSEAAWAEPGEGAGLEGKEAAKGRGCMAGGAGPPGQRRGLQNRWSWAGRMLTLADL